jgi:CheY-like chemotaxis protein
VARRRFWGYTRAVAYYLYDGKAAIGPFEPADLVQRPGFGATTLVFPAGATTADAWKSAASFPDIASALRPPPPPPPPPPASATPLDEITLSVPVQRPLDPSPAAAPASAAAPAAPPHVEEFAPKPVSPSEKLVLVVDDDENVRAFLETSAMMQGFQVITAVNGLDAAEKLAAKPADLIVTDLMMPGQGGYEFLRSLQAASGPRVPVFVVTGSMLDDSTVRMIRQEANVVEFVAKPVRLGAFVAALHKHLKTTPR